MNASAGKNKVISVGRNIIVPHLHRRKIKSRSSLVSSFSTTPSIQSSSSSSSSSSSPSSPWVTVEYPPEDKGRIALVKMNRRPANALSLEMCAELSSAIQTIKDNNNDDSNAKPTTTMVLASSLPKIFSAGLDIGRELYQPDADRLPKFWWEVQQLFLDLYGCSELTTVAALGGHAPAAGCMLALSCDYRIMPLSTKPTTTATVPTIGLNESHLGIVAPPWMAQQYMDVLGRRKGELALLEGTLFPPTAALEHGLVDQLLVIDDDDDDDDDNSNRTTKDASVLLEEAALAKARAFARIPAGARAAVKQLTRRPLVHQLVKDRERDVDTFCNFVTTEPVQHAIGKYLEALQNKAKAAAASKGE